MVTKRTITITLILAALLAAFVLSGRNGPEAMVNGEPIDSAKLEKSIAARIESHKQSGSPVDEDLIRNAIIEQMITQLLIQQGAAEAGIVVTQQEVKAKVDAVRDRHGADVFAKYLLDNGYTEQQYHNVVRERLMKDRFVDAVILKEAFTDEVLLEYYRSSDDPFMAPESAEVRMIEFATFEAASNAVAEMHVKGFDPVADWLARTKAAFVSDYGEAVPSMYPGLMGKAMRELEAGAFGGPYKGRDGFFVIRVKSRQAERPKTYDEARDEIKQHLMKRDRAAAIIRWVAEKRESSEIERR